MRFALVLGCAATAASLAGVSAASARSPEATMTSCMKLSEQVQAAIESNQQSANLDNAKKEVRIGRDFCTNGFYSTGIAHYQEALKALGVSEQSMLQKS